MRKRIAKWLAVLMLLLVAVPANAGIGVQTAYADNQTYEAEAPGNTLSGNTAVTECGECSGGKKVGGLYQGSTLQFNEITVSEEGTYKVTVSYISGDPRSVNISVNSGSVENYDFPKTADWHTVGSFDITLHLNAGKNTILFADGNWYSPDIDKIVVAPSTDPNPGDGGGDGSEPIFAQIYEAESNVNTLAGKASVSSCGSCSGGQKVGDLYQGSSLQFNQIQAKAPGIYTVKLYYISGDPRSIQVGVNGGSAELYDLPKTTDWNTVGTFDVDVTLNAGSNIILLSDGNSYSPDMDKIAVSTKIVSYEAESSANLLMGKASIADCSPCSGGKKVGNLYQGSSLTFNGVEVGAAGKYQVTVSYISGDPRSSQVSVNGGEAETFDFPKTADWDTVGKHVMNLSLAAGSNTLLFADGNGYSPDIDKIEVGPKTVLTPGDDDNVDASLGEPGESKQYGAITVTHYTYGATFSNGETSIAYHTDTGLADYAWKNVKMVKGAYGSLQLEQPELLTSKSYTYHTLSDAAIVPVHDGFGTGIRFTVINEASGKPALHQVYTLYEGKSFFLTQLQAVNTTPMTTNNMAPVVVNNSNGVDIGSGADNRVLFVPFDNDNWIRYKAQQINTANTGYEVTAIYDNTSRNGLVIGSVTHDTWKTGIAWTGYNNKLNNLTVYGGASSNITHDVEPHGRISGAQITSPTVFVGYFADYRAGLEEYGKANAVLTPPLSFHSPVANKVPVGWNSWGAFGSKLSYQDVIDTSNYFKTNLQNNHFNNDGALYINLDSYWDNLTDTQLQNAVKTIRENGQQAGIYWAPFVYWGNDMNQVVEGTNGTYTYGDIVLKDRTGKVLPTLDGAYALDTTHPGTKARIDYFLGKFKSLGFTFIKLDFLTHGSLEGEHADPSVTTGIQAYNQGMAYVNSVIDGSMFISESIAPIFPSQYAHSRRISCDVYGQISETEYELNSLTYGSWQNGTIYPYTDPDHMVLSKASSLNEARSRVNSAVISGTVFLNSDDVHNTTAQAYMNELLTNPDVNQVALLGKAFQAVEGNTGAGAADTFVLNDNGTYYLAVFNYNAASSAAKTIHLDRAGIPGGGSYLRTDVWTGAEDRVSDTLELSLQPAESKLFKLQLDLTPPVTNVVFDGISGSGSFTNKNVTMTFSAEDQQGSTVLKTEYRLDEGDWVTVKGPVTLSAERLYSVDYRSTDRSGNVEQTNHVTVGIDRTAPLIQITEPLTIWQTDALNLSVRITDSLSGIGGSTVKLDHQTAGNPIKAAPATLTVGNHPIDIVATDLAGNVTSNTYTLQVKIDTHHFMDLINIGVANGSITISDRGKELLAKVEAIVRSSNKEATVRQLKLLRIFVEALSGKKISKPFATILIADIDYFIQQANK
ncbi:carbohydrate-binding protein [Paenibacillus sp. 5J-6]|uniref:Carbohydrate-binding protein n=1 Tax=Paenibacillus silvestris TaxID=2606219 RepID=A0A6L8V891_9BACL|nr:carbohydrate-binding protein [Paenibacillus silvestris]MZQ85559.1 carbohydrate-binding protein [Paenibacillus silvestris]